MKANAPEKIYIDDFGSELSHDWHTEHSYENDIEYIRKDAFIEKATIWLLTNASDYCILHNSYDTEELVKDFVDAMKRD